MFNLIDKQDWHAIAHGCERDIEPPRELFIASSSDSAVVIQNWVQIIEEFRDCWVRQSENGSTWEARSIIQEAIVAGVDDPASLNKLAMLPEDATSAERNKAINTMKKKNALKKSPFSGTQQQANFALQEECRMLQGEVQNFRQLLESVGALEDFLAEFDAENQRNEKKNQ